MEIYMNKFNLTDLSIEEVNVIIAGLLELPGKVGLNVFAKVKQQAEEQAKQMPQISSDVPEGPLSDKVVN
jgi:hypothetical protein